MNELKQENNIIIRQLSWKQPFASLMLHGKIETRRWKTNYRGLVLICASKQLYSEDVLESISGHNQIIRIINMLHPINLEDTLGKTIAVGNLADCRPMQPSDEDSCFVKYYPDLFCHIYEKVRPVNQIPWKGSQGWRTLTEDQKKLLHYVDWQPFF